MTLHYFSRNLACTRYNQQTGQHRGDVDDALASRIYREAADHALQAYESLIELGIARSKQGWCFHNP